MSTHFNANQYEDAFIPHRLKNHEVPKGYREHPRTYQGCTEVIGTDRGHLMDSVPRSDKNPWGNFVGTWDLPRQIPGQRYHNPTARSADAHQRMTSSAKQAARVLNGTDKNVKRQAAEADPMGAQTGDAVAQGTRSGADGPASKMIPNSNSPGLSRNNPYQAPEGQYAQLSGYSPPIPDDTYLTTLQARSLQMPATPPEIQKIPTPGLAECVTPPQYPPMELAGRQATPGGRRASPQYGMTEDRQATPQLNGIRTPQVRTPDLRGCTPNKYSPKPASPQMETNNYEPELMME